MDIKMVTKLTPAGLTMLKLLEMTKDWKSLYTISQVSTWKEHPPKWHIEQLKGIIFLSKEEAEEYAYLDWCNKLAVMTLKQFSEAGLLSK